MFVLIIVILLIVYYLTSSKSTEHFFTNDYANCYNDKYGRERCYNRYDWTYRYPYYFNTLYPYLRSSSSSYNFRGYSGYGGSVGHV